MAAHLKAAPVQPGNYFTSLIVIMMHQAYTFPIMTSASKDSANIGVVVAAAMAHHKITAQSDIAAESFMVHCWYVMPFCNAVTAYHSSATLCSTSDDPHIAEWAQSLHTKFIMPCAARQSGIGSGGPSDAMMQPVSATMSNMATTMAHQHDFAVAQSENKAPGLRSSEHMIRS
jgi:hypothetical protein